MSRLDWFTIAVVAICLAAIAFLLFRMTGWNSGVGENGDKTELEIDLENEGLLDNETLDTDNPDADTTAIDIEDASIVDTDEDGSGEDAGLDASSEGGDSFEGDSGSDDGGFEDNIPVNTSPSGANDRDYIVIAGSFSLMHNAENFAKKLKNKGYSNAYVGKFNAGKFASVIVDSFDSSAEASAMVKELKAEGIDAFSKRKR